MTSLHRSIVLVGLMGTGKTTIAKMLAAHFQVSCLDTDKLVELRAGKTVREIFSHDGEDVFRSLESDVMRECVQRKDHVVVAAAGGAVNLSSTRQVIQDVQKEGRVSVVWLHAPTEVLEKRTSRGAHRPLLDEDRRGTLERLAKERSPFYAEISDIVVDVSERSPESVVALIVEAMEHQMESET